MLKTRIITATALIAAFLPALFLASNIIWAMIMLLISVAALYEWASLIDLPKSVSIAYAGIGAAFGALLLTLLMQYGFHWLFYQSLLIFAVSLVFWIFWYLFYSQSILLHEIKLC